MKHVTFQDVAARYAQVMGRKLGVKVTFGGQIAYTNGSVINLPALPAGTTMNPHQSEVMGGYLDHETAHIRYTDFTVFQGKETTSLRQHLFNVFEDVRIENAQIDNYPGSKMYLDALALEVDQKARNMSLDEAKKGNKETWGQKILAMIYKEVYAKYRGVDSKTVDGWLGDFPQLKPIEKYLKDHFMKAKSSADIMKLADECIKLLPPNEDYGQKAEEAMKKFMEALTSVIGKPKPGDGDASGKEAADQGPLQPGQKSKADPKEGDGEGEGQGEPKQDANSKGGGAGQGKPKKMNLEEAKAALQSMMDAAVKEMKARDRSGVYSDLIKEIKKKADREIQQLGQEIRPRTPDPKNQGQYVRSRRTGETVLPPVGTEHDRIFVPSRENLDVYEAERNAMRAEIMATRKMLNLYLASRKKKFWTRGLEEGVLDGTMLHSDSTRVYKEKRESMMVNTSICLMLDLSGSMNASSVRQMAILLAEAMNGIRFLKLQIAGFGTNGKHYHSYGSGKTTVPERDGGRVEGVDIELFKGFEEAYQRCKGRIGGVGCNSSTPLGDGYAYAYEALIKRNETRRVLILISDGEPCIAIKNNRHSEHLFMKQTQQRCKKHQIETVGIGIGDQGSIKEFTEKFVFVKDCSEMPQAVLGMMRGVIVCQ